MTPLFLVLYGVFAILVVEAYSVVLLVVCAAALIYRRNARVRYGRVRHRWIDYVLWFLVARSVLILIYIWVWVD